MFAQQEGLTVFHQDIAIRELNLASSQCFDLPSHTHLPRTIAAGDSRNVLFYSGDGIVRYFLAFDFAMLPLYGRPLCTAPVFFRPAPHARTVEPRACWMTTFHSLGAHEQRLF